MQFLLDFIDWFVSLFTGVFNFLSSFIDSLGVLFDYITYCVELLGSLLDFLPDWLRMFAIASLVIYALYMVIGRSSS